MKLKDLPTLEKARSKLVMLAKDQLQPKKSTGVEFLFIPTLMISLFDCEPNQFDLNKIS